MITEGASIDKVEWSVRAYNVLNQHNIKTVEQLLRLESPRMRRWRNCGTVTIEEIMCRADEVEKEMMQCSKKNKEGVPCLRRK